MTSGVARRRLLLTRLPERPFRPADPRTANRAFQQRRQFDRATPLSDRGDFGAAFWAQAGQNTSLVGARYPHSPSLGSGGAARRPRRNSQHIVRRRVFCGYTWKTPGIPRKYPATAWVSCRFPQFCVRFCPRPALRLRETREFPEWSTKHPLFSLEISGNAKCWGPSVFLFVCRKSLCRPNRLALPHWYVHWGGS